MSLGRREVVFKINSKSNTIQILFKAFLYTLRFLSILKTVSLGIICPSDPYGLSETIIGWSLIILLFVKESLCGTRSSSLGGDGKATPCLSCWDKRRTRDTWPWTTWALDNCSFTTANDEVLPGRTSTAEVDWSWRNGYS